MTWVERNFGYAVARAYAGHNTGRDIGVTATYVRADIHEVAQALAALTGEPHPLADAEPGSENRTADPSQIRLGPAIDLPRSRAERMLLSRQR
ncbi:hypothetical protein [Paractinoplanes hotanensis]|uniref:Integrase n=1 Tax=Paractinoplanes hotanensis TaxID=2906497 RepID=A0ABT0YAL1_9ACTN|nr:hypothetical protein [Actinoplanes hotanensis]MCM4082339.1 hypothetical protein [Actinoplanes hotanensis]